MQASVNIEITFLGELFPWALSHDVILWEIIHLKSPFGSKSKWPGPFFGLMVLVLVLVSDRGSCPLRVSEWGPCVDAVTCGDEDVGEDDERRQEETGCLRQPPSQVTEHAQSKQFGRKINGPKDDLHQINTHLEQPTANRQRGQCVAVANGRRWQIQYLLFLCSSTGFLYFYLLHRLPCRCLLLFVVSPGANSKLSKCPNCNMAKLYRHPLTAVELSVTPVVRNV